MKHQCDNCGERYSDVDLHPIQDLEQRIDPGSVVPSGECPKCGALTYIDTAEDGRRENRLARQLLCNLARRLRMARRYTKRALRLNLPIHVIELHRGQELEAWNSFQAAKAIVYEWDAITSD